MVGGFSPKVRSPSAVLDTRLCRRTWPPGAAFWLLAGVFCLLFVATAAPAPLYSVYQAEWHFSVTTLTAVFAVYALVLLLTLLMFGSVSDYFGRRRTIVAGLAAYGMACGVFLAAGDVAALLIARALQGVAVGLATSALGAALVELQPEGSGLAPPVTAAAGPLGLAIGGFGASALVQYGPARTQFVWWLLLGAGVAGTVAVLAVPESRERSRTRPSFRPRIRVPREARRAFAVALPCLIGIWALSGFYLSLGPSLAAQLLRSQNLLWGGLVIALLFAVGVPVTLTVRNSSPSKVMLGGCVALFAGAGITFVAIATGTSAVLLAGSAVAGLGWGPAWMGAYGTIVVLARPDQRAGLIAAIFTVGYLAFSIPALIAGVATSHYGLHKTALVYAPVVAVLAAAAVGGLLLRRARTASDAPATTAHPGSPPGGSTIRPTAADLCRQTGADVSG
jgi:MFS family permease